MDDAQRGFFARLAPGLLVMALAPLFTELLLGGTRLSTIVAFPPIIAMETIVWGGGALMLRALARRLRLPPGGLLLLGLVIACAEEFIIQQTSLAPVVIRLRGVEWGRAAGVNYVYALWALGYETVWVVLAPTFVAELLFPARRGETWLSRGGLAVVGLLFPLGAVAAWYGWTRIARVRTFHLPIYDPPASAFFAAMLVIAGLAIWATRFPPRPGRPAAPPPPGLVALGAAAWAVLWYGLMLLAFGIAPAAPAPAMFATGLALIVAATVAGLRWVAHPDWTLRHGYAALAGALTAAMFVSFFGFQGAARMDVVFKLVTNALALVALALVGRRAAHWR